MLRHQQRMLFENMAVLAGGKIVGMRNLLMQLRKCCLHPSLITNDYEALSSTDTIDRFTRMSGKLRMLERILDKLIPRGHRILIYSQVSHLSPIPSPHPSSWRSLHPTFC